MEDGRQLGSPASALPPGRGKTLFQLQAQIAESRRKHRLLTWCLFALGSHKYILIFNTKAVCLQRAGDTEVLLLVQNKCNGFVITKLISKYSPHLTHICPWCCWLASLMLCVAALSRAHGGEGSQLCSHFLSPVLSCELVMLAQKNPQATSGHEKKCRSQKPPYIQRCVWLNRHDSLTLRTDVFCGDRHQ